MCLQTTSVCKALRAPSRMALLQDPSPRHPCDLCVTFTVSPAAMNPGIGRSSPSLSPRIPFQGEMKAAHNNKKPALHPVLSLTQSLPMHLSLEPQDNFRP